MIRITLKRRIDAVELWKRSVEPGMTSKPFEFEMEGIVGSPIFVVMENILYVFEQVAVEEKWPEYHPKEIMTGHEEG